MLELEVVSKEWNDHEVEACVQSMIYAWNVLEVSKKTRVTVKFLRGHSVYTGLTEQERVKSYLIRLYYNTEGIDAMMKTAMHEMVHVAQFRSGKLRYEPAMVWYDGTVDSDDLAYLESPWEKEAYAMEEVLFKQLKSS